MKMLRDLTDLLDPRNDTGPFKINDGFYPHTDVEKLVFLRNESSAITQYALGYTKPFARTLLFGLLSGIIGSTLFSEQFNETFTQSSFLYLNIDYFQYFLRGNFEIYKGLKRSNKIFKGHK